MDKKLITIAEMAAVRTGIGLQREFIQPSAGYIKLDLAVDCNHCIEKYRSL
jgi:hypothetical protein